MLDIGASVNPLVKNGITVDLNKKKRPDICASVLYLPLREKSFNNVNFTEVIEHIRPKFQVKALKEIRRVTKNLVISTPSMFPTWRIIWAIWENTVQKEYRHDHVGQLPIQNLFRKLAKSGFKVTKWQRVMFFDVIVKCE